MTDNHSNDITAASQRFNDWVNAEIRAGNLQVETMLELIGNLYVRMRAHVELPVLLQQIERVVSLVESKIDQHALNVQLPDGTPVPFLSVEQQQDQPGLMEMVREAGQGIDDSEFDTFLTELERG